MKFKVCDSTCFSRRDAVETGARLGVAFVATGFIASCGHDDREKASGDPGNVVPVTNGIATLDFATYPDLAKANGSYRVNLGGTPVSVTRVSETSAAAVAALCTHEGATLDGYSNAGFTCPRHGATFTADGTVTGGPARTNLTTYPATIGGSAITVKVG